MYVHGMYFQSINQQYRITCSDRAPYMADSHESDTAANHEGLLGYTMDQSHKSKSKGICLSVKNTPEAL
jgi:hypothetical protein